MRKTDSLYNFTITALSITLAILSDLKAKRLRGVHAKIASVIRLLDSCYESHFQVFFIILYTNDTDLFYFHCIGEKNI